MAVSEGLVTPPQAIGVINGKGSFVAPLFFLALGLACAGSLSGYVTPWAASVIAIAAAAWVGSTARQKRTWLSIAIQAYCLMVVISTLLLSPAYSPAGLYHPALLAASFFAIRGLGDQQERAAALAVLAAAAILVTWGFVQVGILGWARAQALFETPATFAAVLNCVLVTLLAATILGARSSRLLVVAALLAAGLFAADSRGGLVALAAGLGVAAILGVRCRLLRTRALGPLLLVLVVGWIAATGLRATLPIQQREPSPSAETRAESSLGRLELYSLAWKAWLDQPLAGTGYLTYRYVQEQGRTQAPSFGESRQTWFVHNDYLQTLQELGPVGLLTLLGLAVFPPLFAYRRLPSLAEGQKLPVVASASALAAMSVHALVDFPFYVPATLLLYGALLGALDRRFSHPASARAWQTKPWYRPVRTGVVVVVAVVLMRPVLAEAAAEWGLRKSAAGEGQSAAFWLGAAQRIDPRDWRYHWYAGQFWDAQAAHSGKREAARLAADAYAAGFDANSLEVRNLLGIISVHRRHRNLLDEPADSRTLQDWLAQAEALAPLNPAVQWERSQ